jgi:hypothetical protein
MAMIVDGNLCAGGVYWHSFTGPIGLKNIVITCFERTSIIRITNVSLKTQILINLIVLAIIDTVIPIPITAMVLIMVLFQKPKWFKDWADRIYRD